MHEPVLASPPGSSYDLELLGKMHTVLDKLKLSIREVQHQNQALLSPKSQQTSNHVAQSPSSQQTSNHIVPSPRSRNQHNNQPLVLDGANHSNNAARQTKPAPHNEDHTQPLRKQTPTLDDPHTGPPPNPFYFASTVCGTPLKCGATNGSFNECTFNQPYGIACLTDYFVVVSDHRNGAIRYLRMSKNSTKPRISQVGSISSGTWLHPKGLSAVRLEHATGRFAPVSVSSSGKMMVDKSIKYNPNYAFLACDSGHHKIRLVVLDARAVQNRKKREKGSKPDVVDSTTRVVAGTGRRGFRDGPADLAQFNNPQGLCVLHDGTVVVADTGNHALRGIRYEETSRKLVVFTLAGSRRNRSSGSIPPGLRDGFGRDAQFNAPTDVVVCNQNQCMYVADSKNRCIRRVHFHQRKAVYMVKTIAGTPHATDGRAELRNGSAVASRFGSLGSLTLHQPTGYLFATDQNAIRMLVPSPSRKTFDHVITIAGTDQPIASLLACNTMDHDSKVEMLMSRHCDGDVVSTAKFHNPRGLYLHPKGMLVCDTDNHCIRALGLFDKDTRKPRHKTQHAVEQARPTSATHDDNGGDANLCNGGYDGNGGNTYDDSSDDEYDRQSDLYVDDAASADLGFESLSAPSRRHKSPPQSPTRQFSTRVQSPTKSRQRQMVTPARSHRPKHNRPMASNMADRVTPEILQHHPQFNEQPQVRRARRSLSCPRKRSRARPTLTTVPGGDGLPESLPGHALREAVARLERASDTLLNEATLMHVHDVAAPIVKNQPKHRKEPSSSENRESDALADVILDAFGGSAKQAPFRSTNTDVLARQNQLGQRIHPAAVEASAVEELLDWNKELARRNIFLEELLFDMVREMNHANGKQRRSTKPSTQLDDAVSRFERRWFRADTP